MIKVSDLQFIEKFACQDSLATFDPYDIWKTKFGLKTKQLYYKNKYLGIIPASILSIYDQYLNNKIRFGYKKQEYPIVRAQAALSLLNLYKKTKKTKYLNYAKKHIDWLLDNYSKGYSGFCWGTGFKIVISDTLIYDKNTPFSTNTPYILEALHYYYQNTKEPSILEVIESIYQFYEKDILIIKEDKELLITSYAPYKDRVVTNAVSYTMYAYSIFYNYINDQIYIANKINKMYQFIKNVQQNNGSWMYAPYDDNSFIDCFHSCFVLKNIYKTNKEFELYEASSIIEHGYQFIKTSFYDDKSGLYKRFAKKNKPSFVKFDLYDNSEMLYLAKLLNDKGLVKDLMPRIETSFFANGKIFSVIDLFGFNKNENTLRWAVMPYILAISQE